MLYPVTLLKSLIPGPRRFSGIFYIDKHVVCKQEQFFFFLSKLYASYFLLLPYEQQLKLPVKFL